MNTYYVIIISALLLITAAVIIIKRYKKHSSNKYAENIFQSMKYLANGQDLIAAEGLKKAALEGRGGPEIYFILAVLYRKHNDPVKAIHLNETLLIRDVLDDKAKSEVFKELYTSYLIALEESALERSIIIKNLDNTIKRFKGTTNELLPLESLYHRLKGELEDALKYVQKYEKLTGTLFPEMLSCIYLDAADKTSDWNKKIKALKQAISVYPDGRKAYFKLADCYIQNNKSDAAISTVIDALNKGKIRCKADLECIENAFFKFKTVDELQKLMHDKISNGSTDPAPYLYLYSFYKKQGNMENAIFILKKYLERYTCNVILKEYLKLTADNITNSSVKINNIYKCKNCGHEQSFFKETCPSCAVTDSFYYF